MWHLSDERNVPHWLFAPQASCFVVAASPKLLEMREALHEQSA
ncbi:Uncharacterised protein [Vibrio cholerae]|nr:Uncharacterised protein [Vibrio cholerae]CSD11719.1 Uncharacterised protein [Vibrio cholerae]